MQQADGVESRRCDDAASGARVRHVQQRHLGAPLGRELDGRQPRAMRFVVEIDRREDCAARAGVGAFRALDQFERALISACS